MNPTNWRKSRDTNQRQIVFSHYVFLCTSIIPSSAVYVPCCIDGSLPFLYNKALFWSTLSSINQSLIWQESSTAIKTIQSTNLCGDQSVNSQQVGALMRFNLWLLQDERRCASPSGGTIRTKDWSLCRSTPKLLLGDKKLVGGWNLWTDNESVEVARIAKRRVSIPVLSKVLYCSPILD